MCKKTSTCLVLLIVAISLFALYVYMYYPQQSMPVGEQVSVTTIDTMIYHNDCLHPCIRYNANSGKYYMASSPYYAWNNQVENPMFYVSDDYMRWDNGILIADTPKKGYNSDPNIYIYDNGEILYLWRECGTPLCDSLECDYITVGGKIGESGIICKRFFCINHSSVDDIEQAPVMISYSGKRYIYATWYQYEPKRKNKGVAIWEQGENDTMIYRLVDTIPFKTCYTVDKCAQIRVWGIRLYIPKPLYYDMWHFDLFEYGGKLYMVSCSENGDNIMLSVSEDRKKFMTYRKPLVNNHYTENYCGYRQYYYKPTAFVKDDTLHVFYTANAKDDLNRNKLYHTAKAVSGILK